MEAAVKALKMGKSAGVDNISAELVQAGGEAMIDILTAICNKIWKTGKWPTTWTHSLVIRLPKKGNLQLCQNYRTISLISHPSKVMLKIILNRLQPQAEEIIAEEQAGFRAGRSTTDQIFNPRIFCEKYLRNIGGRLITNFRFADDIVVNAEEEEEAGVLVDRLDRTTTKIQNGDRSRQEKSDDKQPKWLPKKDQDKRPEARRSGKLQVPWGNHL